ncbi:MAG: aminopeptidase, partial [Acidobacteria bacterium]
RILEVLYGPNRRQMEAMLGKQNLLEELKSLPEADQILHVNLKGRDPDDAFTGVPYEKGALFLWWLKDKFGQEKFDRFLRSYFDSHAFRSITTETFVSFLQKSLLEVYPGIVSMDEVQRWIESPGLPKDAPSPYSENFKRVETLARSFLNGGISVNEIDAKNWTTQEWLHFLKAFPETPDLSKMKALDDRFKLTNVGNSEIAFQWLMMAIRSNYEPARSRLRDFLISVGRRKFVRPLYAELAKSPEGKRLAQEIYLQARKGYHPITQASIDAILK